MKPEVSIPVALATTAVVYGTYQAALPSLADARSIEPDNDHLASAERQALILAVAVAGGISLISKDATPFIFGGLVAVGLSWMHRWSNQVDERTGRPIQQSGVARRVAVDVAG